MGQAPVAFAALLVIVREIIRIAGFATPQMSTSSHEVGQHRIAEIRHPAHQTQRMVGADLFCARAEFGGFKSFG